MSQIFEEFSTFVSIYAFFRYIVKRGMFAARVWKSVECWILFYRYKPHWSSAPENNIYKCIFVWRQLLLVYNGGIHHRRHLAMLMNKKLFFHVNSVKNSFIVLSISAVAFVIWL